MPERERLAAMPRCGGCRWWDTSYGERWPDTYQPTEKSSLSSRPDIAHRDGRWGVCVLTTYGREGGYSYDHPESFALAHDHERYAAELLTRPDFGCVQWEQRDGTGDG